MVVLGIDPGKDGGLAILDTASGLPCLLVYMRMPTTTVGSKTVVDGKQLTQLMVPWRNEIDVTVLERVHAMPKQGVSSSFSFGRAFGAVEFFAQSLEARLEYVTPAKWKRDMGLTSSKQASLDLATQKFGTRDPWKFKADDGIAEAALMALWFIDKAGRVTDVCS